jgi:hypothetical protein
LVNRESIIGGICNALFATESVGGGICSALVNSAANAHCWSPLCKRAGAFLRAALVCS